jgi:hypothetical protein
MGNTALLLHELGDNRTIDLSPSENQKAIEMFKRLGNPPTKKEDKEQVKKEMRDPVIAYQLGQYLSEYEKQVIQDKVQVRTVVMNRLMQISQDEDNKVALKALELLGIPAPETTWLAPQPRNLSARDAFGAAQGGLAHGAAGAAGRRVRVGEGA